MIYITVLILFLSIFFLLNGILAIINGNKIKIEKRLNELKETKIGNEEKFQDMSFSARMIRPFYQNLSNTLMKITPKRKLEVLNKRLERAGILKNSTIAKWIVYKSMVVLISGLTIGLLAMMVSPNIIKASAIAILIMLSINYFFNFSVSLKIEDRKKKIIKDLPYTLDLIVVSVEAGLSFDGAMSRVVSNIGGELCDEFAKSLKEIKMGIERKVALRNMSERCDVRELSTFITSLIQADELGVSLSRVLRIESANLRERRRQLSREKAMKAPIKMLFPLVFFILPSLFIIILGPAVVRIVEMFK